MAVTGAGSGALVPSRMTRIRLAPRGSLTACEPARPARAVCWPLPFQAWQLAHAPSKMRRPVPSLASPPGDHEVDALTAALIGITAAAASIWRGVSARKYVTMG